MIDGVKIGADVELFVQHKPSKEIVSAEGMIKGTKDVPFIFDPTNKYFATSLDNVLAEFCIPPATNKVEFYNYLRKSMAYINKTLPKDYCTAVMQAVVMDEKWLQTKHAQLFGCEPDFNAYTGRQNDRPNAEDKRLRSAGGHIHISWRDILFPYVEADYKGDFPKKHYLGDEQRCQLIRAIDLNVGVPSVILEPDNKRKELYGKAGCFRPKEYGVEYRTISNFYLQSRKLTNWVYDAIMAAIAWINEGNVIDEYFGRHIEDTINNNDKHLAIELVKTFNLKMI